MKKIILILSLVLTPLTHAEERCLTKYQELSKKRNENKKIADTVIVSTIVIEAGLMGANHAEAPGGGPTDNEKKISAATLGAGVIVHLIFARQAAKVDRMVEFLSDAERFIQSDGKTIAESTMKRSYPQLWKAYKKYLKKAKGEVIDLSTFASGIHEADLKGYACGARYNSKGIAKPKQVVEVMLDYLD